MKVAMRVGAMLVVGALMACSGTSDTKTDTASAKPMAADKVGEPESPPCNVGNGGCIGVTNLHIEGKPRDAARFVKDLDDGNLWGTPSAETDRSTTDGQRNARLVVRTIKNSNHLALKNIANFSAIMGRIDVISISATESFFRITPQDAAAAGNRFYVIATGFKKESPSGNIIRFGKWQLYGVTSAGLKKFGEKRDFSYCIVDHEDRTHTARFTTCEDADRMHQIASLPAFSSVVARTGPLGTFFDLIRGAIPGEIAASSVSATSVKAALEALGVNVASLPAALLEEIAGLLRDEHDDPFWLTCGVGCCTTGT